MNSEVKVLRDEIVRLIANDKKRQKSNDELVQTIDKQNLEIADLRKRLAYYENPHTPPSMRSLEYKRQKKEQRERKKNNNNNNNDDGPAVGQKRGRKPGHVGASHSRKADRSVEKKITKCKCGSTNLKFEKICQKLVTDSQPAQIITENQTYFRSRCSDCSHVTDAKPIKDTELGPHLLSEIAILWNAKVSIDGITNIINTRYGTQFCPATIQHGLDATSSKLDSQYSEIQASVQDNDVPKNIDETVMPMNGERMYVWVVSTRDRTCFVVAPSRAGVVLQIYFPNIRSRITSDGYAVYKQFGKRQHCWAHILYEAKFMARDKSLEPLYAELLDVFEYAKSVKTDVKEIRKRLESRVTAIGEMYLQKDEKFGTKLHNAVLNLFTFLEYPDLEPTNNRAERALRDPVLHRKVRGQLRTSRGMRMFSILTSCMYTWKSQGRNIQDELLKVLVAT